MAATTTSVDHAILTALSNTKEGTPIFDTFIEECQKIYDAGAHSIQELKQKCTKAKGDIFEVFTVLLLEKVYGWEKVWLLKDVPDDILTQLGLPNRDMGIDIIGYHHSDYYAVQCKYKKKNPHKTYTVVGWKELSTFQALCARSGPWKQQIVVTNCDYVRHQGQKAANDKTIARKRLQGLSRTEWLAMAGDMGHQLGHGKEEIPTPVVTGSRKIILHKKKVETPQQLSAEEIRAKRLAYFSQQ